MTDNSAPTGMTVSELREWLLQFPAEAKVEVVVVSHVEKLWHSSLDAKEIPFAGGVDEFFYYENLNILLLGCEYV